MTAFTYRDGVLCAEALPLTDIAGSVGTPFYCYSTAMLEGAYAAFAEAFAGQPVDIHYAMKANSNRAVVATLAAQGAGADVVSEGEMRLAIAAGVAPDHIVFSGVGKSREELTAALDAGVGQINVESVPELEALSALASARGGTVDIAIRVNPDVDAGTHAKITTGVKGNKFGIDIEHAAEVFRRAAELPGLNATGIAIHIGSQLTELGPFRNAFTRLAELVGSLRGLGLTIDRLDLGGGLGIAYQDEVPPSLPAYAELVREIVVPTGCRIMIEPGRALVGNAGVLVSRVIYRKQGQSRVFLIVDAAMNDLLRPSLYEAWHTILPVRQSQADTPHEPVDVVGPICESGDTFAVQRHLPHMDADDLLAFTGAGAYGSVMASTYNARPLVPEVLVSDGKFAVVRKRPTFAEMMALEAMPPWLAAP